MINDTYTPEQSPVMQAEAYFTECVIIASEIKTEVERKEKFEQCKVAAMSLLNFQIDYWIQTRAEFEQIIDITNHKKVSDD